MTADGRPRRHRSAGRASRAPRTGATEDSGWARPSPGTPYRPVPTFGGHGQLPPDRLDALLTGIGDAVDAMGGVFSMHYTALVLTSVRAG